MIPAKRLTVSRSMYAFDPTSFTWKIDEQWGDRVVVGVRG